MAIHFSKERLETVIGNHARWWRGELDRALLRVTVTDMYAPSHTPQAPILSQSSCADFNWSAEQMIDALDAELSCFEFMGDAYPVVDFACFGPGMLAACLGSELDNSTGQVWFHPCEPDVTKLHVRYDPENKWSRRIKDLYRAGLERWEGSVVMTLPDLGGNLDILASLCGTENLIYALVDEPEHCHRLIGEIETAWRAAYADFRQVLEPQGVYTDWNGLLSREPSYIPQCDFSYMLGPEMFTEFVLPVLRRDTECLENTIYHLDGVGQLKHLDSILSLPKLKAVQWVFGVGQPGPDAWLDVYGKILAAGKQIMICDGILSGSYEKVRSSLGKSPYGGIWIQKDALDVAKRLLDLG